MYRSIIFLAAALCATSSGVAQSPTLATFNTPSGVAVLQLPGTVIDTVFVADYQSVRKIKNNVVTTVAGPTHLSSGGLCPTGYTNGIGTAARFNYISAITINPVNQDLYVTEHTNNVVRKITQAGLVSLVAGQGPVALPVMTPSVDGVGGAATFNHPSGITIDTSGQYLYVADSYDYSIRRIDISTNSVATIVFGRYTGATIPSAARLSNPTGLRFQGNHLYIIDQGYGRVRDLDLSIYTGTPLNPSVMPVVAATGVTFQFNHPAGIYTDYAGMLYVTEGNGPNPTIPNDIVRGPYAGGVFARVAGGAVAGNVAAPTGTNARFNTPAGVAYSGSNNLYIADQRNNLIKRMRTVPPFPTDIYAGHAPGPLNVGCRDGTA